LHTVFERLLEEVSFHAPERGGSEVEVDLAFVRKALGEFLQNEDLTRYIL
jgi:ATP-dependent HslUV protease ATP-binding subunit HslU